MADFDAQGPTWWEGWWAHAVGWPLCRGHSKSYVAGWKARAEFARHG
jgi:hypothetical protein